MIKTLINDITVFRLNEEISVEEATLYLEEAQAKQEQKIVEAVIGLDGEDVVVKCYFEEVPFERIRRITGYLVGTTDRWNNAKQAEEKDRVKHN